MTAYSKHTGKYFLMHHSQNRLHFVESLRRAFYKQSLFYLMLVFLVLMLAVPATSGQEVTPDVGSTELEPPSELALYEPIVLRMEIDPATYSNPFDPSDIELVAIFESPSGQQITMPGFWLQPYQDLCEASCIMENLQPVGDAEWQVRFTPTEVGTWTYTLQARDDGAALSTQHGEFTVVPSSLPGFIRVAPNGRYFQYDNGTPYFVIGPNLNWSWEGAGGLEAYERWFDALSQSGGNYARLIIDVPWFVGLEWDAAGDYRGNQLQAARLDYILEMAQARGIALQLVLLWHQSLRQYIEPPVLLPTEPGRPDTSADWNDNPYNGNNGGPLASVGFFYSDETAKNLFRRRLRYIVSRWGYSPQVFAWEIVDEIDRAGDADPNVKNQWLIEMASYLRQIDPHQHLITAGSNEYRESLIANPLLDFTQARFFQSLPIESTAEQESATLEILRRNLRLNDAPSLLTAFSLNRWYEPTENDPSGVHFQNSLWAMALAGAAGGGVSAWGDTYIMAEGFEQYYAPLAAFASGVDWGTLHLRPAEAGLLTRGERSYLPVRVDNFNRRFRDPVGDVATRTITADGVFPALDQIPSYLYGQVYNSTLNHVQTYTVAAPVDSYLEIGIRAVSDLSFARLVIIVDDRMAAEMALQQNTRGSSVRVPLSAGEHTIVLMNTGEDWLEMAYIEVGNLIAPARVLTLRDSASGVALAWLQHRDYTWDKVAADVERTPLTFTYRLDQMPSGVYQVEIWNPITGAVMGEEMVRVGADGVLRVDLLPLTDQLALRAFRQPESAADIATEIVPASTESSSGALPEAGAAVELTPENSPE